MSAKDPRDPRPLIGRRKDESAEAHAAFLLFVSLAPEHRSGRRVHILLEMPESSVRLWRGRYQWEERIAALGGEGTETEALAAEQFATHYASKLKRPLSEYRKHLRVPYTPPPADKRAASPPPPPKAEGEEGADPPEVDEASTAKAEAAVGAGNHDRIGRLLNVAEIRILQAIAGGKVKYGIGDIEKVLRIKDRLERSRRAALLESQGTSASGGTTETLAKSERVLRAQADGGDVLAAVAEDLEELALIVSTLRDSEASNVVPLARAREGGG